MMKPGPSIAQTIHRLTCGVLLFLFACTSQPDVKTKTADVIVYDGTSAAVSIAMQVKRIGKSVLIACPDNHLGGMTSSELGFTDTKDKSVIGGIVPRVLSATLSILSGHGHLDVAKTRRLWKRWARNPTVAYRSIEKNIPIQDVSY